jgi:GT2 family glycosyltransferase
MISLCTWCRDWPPLRETVPLNLALIAGRDVEWCITDLGSTDGTWEFLAAEAAANPQLQLFHESLEPLHFARAYNLAFGWAAGEILVCLDADNVIGPRFLDVVAKQIAANPRAFVHTWSGNWTDGTCGRMAMHRDVFAAIGGYDESLGVIGHQDIDLRDRAAAAGYPTVTINEPDVVGYAFLTRDEEKLQHLPGVDYRQVNSANVAISQGKLANKQWRANQ